MAGKKILLALSDLSLGGTQRVAVTLANYWAEQGWAVSILTFAPISEDFFPLHPGIQREALGLTTDELQCRWQSNWRRWQWFRHNLRTIRPSLMIAFHPQPNLLAIISRLGLGIPLIMVEHAVIEHQILPGYVRAGRQLLYRFAERLSVQTESARRKYSRFIPASKISVIPNSVTPPADISLIGHATERTHTIVSLGRLEVEKGYESLIQAFGELAGENDWQLVIYGEGTQRPVLENMIREMGLKHRIHLPGASRNIWENLRAADIFVLSSRHEGFSIALVEAMACGLPVISFDCPEGPREIIHSEIDGVLLPPGDIKALAAALRRLINDPVERRRLGVNALKVRERFSAANVSSMWDRLISQVMAGK